MSGQTLGEALAELEKERTAIIRDVGIGMRDCYHPVLWFTTYLSESSAALQIIPWDKAAVLIEEGGIYDVKSLEGKPCTVEVNGSFITFKRLWKKK